MQLHRLSSKTKRVSLRLNLGKLPRPISQTPHPSTHSKVEAFVFPLGRFGPATVSRLAASLPAFTIIASSLVQMYAISNASAAFQIIDEDPMQIRLASIMVENQDNALPLLHHRPRLRGNKDIPMGPSFRW